MLDHLGDLVLKPTFPGTRGDPIFGAALSIKEREALLDRRASRTRPLCRAGARRAFHRAGLGGWSAPSAPHGGSRVCGAVGRKLCRDAGRSDARLHFSRQHGGVHPARRRQQRYLGAGRWPRASVHAACVRPRIRSMSAAPPSIFPAVSPTISFGWAVIPNAWKPRCESRAPFFRASSRKRTPHAPPA